MIRNFTFKEVKQLIKFYKNLLDNLAGSSHSLECELTNIREKFNKLKANGYFANKANHEITGSKYQESDIDFDKLLVAISRYLSTEVTTGECKQLFNDISQIYQPKLKNLKIAKNPLYWFLTGRLKKEEIITSVNYLRDFKESDLVNKSITNINSLQNIKINIDSVRKDFLNNQEGYYEILTKATYDACDVDKPLLYKVRFLIDKNNDLVTQIEETKGKTDKSIEKVVSCIENMVMDETFNVLKSIPVEKLTTERPGIRVGNLKKSGYANVFDVYTAPVSKLCCTKGVSEESAYFIKDTATEYKKEVQKTIKIKLSYDNQTQYATELVCSIFSLRKIIEYINKLNHLNQTYSSDIKNSFEIILTTGNGILWPFLKEEKKLNYISNYQFIKTVLFESYQPLINAILLEFNMFQDPVEAWNDFKENSIEFYNLIEQIYPGVLGDSKLDEILPGSLSEDINNQDLNLEGLRCTLRKYQVFGAKFILHQKRVLLGDEMGLGKTIQAIASMVSLRNGGRTHFVVICPAGVLVNWCREIAKHSNLKVFRIHGYDKEEMLKNWNTQGGVAVLTFETSNIFGVLGSDYVIDQLTVDEAHYIKNPSARRSKRVRSLCTRSKRILFMTGTALENRVDEMIELINILRPNVAEQLKKIAFMSTAPQFREQVAPVYFRRKKEDVLTELPDLIENQEWCNLLPDEEKAYEQSVLSKNYMAARRVSWNMDDISNSSKAKRLLEIIENAKNEERKVLVFSFFLDTIRKIYDFLGESCLTPITGGVSSARRQEIIDKFNNSPAGTVLCSQIQSGGTGLNIQAASVVVICEPQLKPSIENQAISRSHRMGQSRNVQVFRLLCEDTIDERMMELLKNKQEVFDTFADKSISAEQTIEIDDKSFVDLMEEETKRIQNKYGLENIPAPVTQEYDYHIPYDQQLNMTYKELVDYLLKKYGPAKGDYFLTKSCKSKNAKIARGNEGLFCHHMDEDKAIMLSTTEFALKNPFEYQKADRLVYCNILEHLILHIKIAEEPRHELANRDELTGIGGAINFICPQINDYYSDKPLTRPFDIRIREQIKDNFSDYILILKYLWNVIENNSIYRAAITKKDICKGYSSLVNENVLNALSK